MKKPKNELMTFLAGLVMLVAGLFIFSQKVIVYSSFFGGFSIRGAQLSSGMVIVPLIIGIIWMFATGSFLSKVFSALAGLLIVVAVILTTNIRLQTITLFDWILILVLIFGGLGLLARVLLADRNEEKDRSRNSYYEDMMASYTEDNHKKGRK